MSPHNSLSEETNDSLFRSQIICHLFTITSFVAFLFQAPHAYTATSGKLILQLSSMYDQKSPVVTSNKAAVRLNLDHQSKWGRTLSFNLSQLLISDPLEKSEEERLFSETKTLTLSYKRSATYLRVGLDSVNWEGTDLINPMDLISPKIYFNPTGAEQRGSAGLFYSDKIGPILFDAVFIPWQTSARLPGKNSPWWPRVFSIPTQSTDTMLLLPAVAEYEISNEEVLSGARENNAGLRLHYHGDSFDLSIAGFEGQTQTPLLQPFVSGSVLTVPPKSVIQIDSTIRIQPIYYRVRSGAFAVTKTFDDLIIRLGCQNVQPLGSDSRLPSWSQLGVLSVEKNFVLKTSTLTTLAQAVHSREAESSSLSVLSNLTKRSLGVGFRWPFSDGWAWTSAAFQEQVTHSTYIYSDITWSYAEDLAQSLVLDVFLGEKGSSFGTYDQNDRLILRTSYVF